MSDDSLRLTLCLHTATSSDGLAYVTYSRGSGGKAAAAVGGIPLDVNAVLPRALPSRVAAALHQSFEALPPGARGAFLLAGPSLEERGLGDGVLRGLAAAALVAQVHCLGFAVSPDGAVLCEQLTAEGGMAHGAGRLTALILRQARASGGRVASVEAAAALTPSHAAALALADHRRLFLFAGPSDSAAAVAGRVAEARLAARAVAGPEAAVEHSGDGGLVDSPRRWLPTPHANSDDPATTTPSTPAAPATASEDGLKALREEVRELRIALQTAAEERDALEMEQRASSGLVRRLRQQQQKQQQRQDEVDGTAGPTATATTTSSAAVAPAAAATAAATTTAPQTAIAPTTAVAAGAAGEVAQLRSALVAAQQARASAEERMRLLEFREKLTKKAAKSGTGLDPAPHKTDASVDESRLVADFQRQELEWQAALRAAREELAAAQESVAELEDTVQLQSRTITAAKHAIEEERRRHAAELAALLESVKGIAPSDEVDPPRPRSGIVAPDMFNAVL